MKKKLLSVIPVILLALITVFPAGGCLGSGKSSKHLTTFYKESTVAAARFYQREGEGSYTAVELAEDQVDGFADMLDEMELKKHSFCADYYWDGLCGIELELADGNYITYDGTLISLRSESVLNDGYNSDNCRDKDFLEVTNCEYWEEVQKYFPEAVNVLVAW